MSAESYDKTALLYMLAPNMALAFHSRYCGARIETPGGRPKLR